MRRRLLLVSLVLFALLALTSVLIIVRRSQESKRQRRICETLERAQKLKPLDSDSIRTARTKAAKEYLVSASIAKMGG